MKIKNNSQRNVIVSQGNILLKDDKGNTGFGAGIKINLIAGATLEIDDSDYEKVKGDVQLLVKAEVLTVVSAPKTKMTKSDIIAKVMLEADVELKDSMTLAVLQKKAEALGVEV